ncbi:hypothetical protein ACLX1H_000451 [Fusarium chlamydosporum]
MIDAEEKEWRTLFDFYLHIRTLYEHTNRWIRIVDNDFKVFSLEKRRRDLVAETKMISELITHLQRDEKNKEAFEKLGRMESEEVDVKGKIKEEQPSYDHERMRAMMDAFMKGCREAMRLILEGFPSKDEQSSLPPADRYLSVIDNIGIRSEPASLPASKAVQNSKRNCSDDVQEPRKVKRRRTITLEQLSRDFKNQVITERPRNSGNFYVFRCDEHGKRFERGKKPILAAARHITAKSSHKLKGDFDSAVEALGIRVLDCDASHKREHNAQVCTSSVQEQSPPPREASPDVSRTTANIAPPSDGRRPQRAAVEKSTRLIFSFTPDPERPLRPAEIEPNKNYLCKHGDKVYPCRVLPWGPYQPLDCHTCAPVDLGLLESESDLPPCYDRSSGLNGCWAEGYRDDEAKMSKRQYPILWYNSECQVSFVLARNLRAYDEGLLNPEEKDFVNSFWEGENGMSLWMNPPPIGESSSSSSSSSSTTSPRRGYESSQDDLAGYPSLSPITPYDTGPFANSTPPNTSDFVYHPYDDNGENTQGTEDELQI